MLLNTFDDNLVRVMVSYVGALVVPAALIFAGARLGLRRDLVRLHGWRLLGASIAAMASVSVLFYLALQLLDGMLGVGASQSHRPPANRHNPERSRRDGLRPEAVNAESDPECCPSPSPVEARVTATRPAPQGETF